MASTQAPYEEKREMNEKALCKSNFHGRSMPSNMRADQENAGSTGSDVASGGEDFTWTVEEETEVRRKLDYYIVPLTTFLYLMCFLDRYVIWPKICSAE